MTEHFVRHGDVLTVVTIVDDPVPRRAVHPQFELGLEPGAGRHPQPVRHRR
jgi:hypothetical protein